MRRSHLLLVLLALLAVLPLLAGGPSCGHDFQFHLQSWLDAAEQLRHGTLYPHWAFSAAYNSGEPRFLFYPPLSWTIGALLTFALPFRFVPIAYTALALLLAAFTMHRLARTLVPPASAFLVTALYIANPYMLFTAFERTAYAELLAAAWLPLLFESLLAETILPTRIALPLALLWLTNAPAAVIGSYSLALILAVRLIVDYLHTRSLTLPLRTLRNTAIGAALGLALPAFYLLPAAYERRYVQIAMALVEGVRVPDNFLFEHIGDAPHDAVLHAVSLIALSFLLTTSFALAVLIDRHRSASEHSPHRRHAAPIAILVTLTAGIAFLLTRPSLFFWNHLPELIFLQFPWRFLCALAVVLCLAAALLLRSLRIHAAAAVPASILIVLTLSLNASHFFRQHCEPEDVPSSRLAMFTAHLGVEATDEYTPNDADNETIRSDDPPYWLSTNPQSFALGTTPNPNLHEPGRRNFQPPALSRFTARTVPTHSPIAFHVLSPSAEFLILNLRAFPSWHITLNGHDATQAANTQRDDGLLVLAIPSGPSDIQITWRRTPDQWLGIALTAAALLPFTFLHLKSEKHKPH